MRLEGALTPPRRSAHESVQWVTLGMEAWRSHEPGKGTMNARRNREPWTQKLRVCRRWRGMLSHWDTPQRPGSAHVLRGSGSNEVTLYGPPKRICPRRLRRVDSESCALPLFHTGHLQFQANTLFPSWKHRRAWPWVNHSPYHIPFPSPPRPSDPGRNPKWPSLNGTVILPLRTRGADESGL